MLQKATQKNIRNYKEPKNLVNSIICHQKRPLEKKMIENIEKYNTNPRLFFKLYKSVKGYKEQNCAILDSYGNLITETQSIINIFKELFKLLLNDI